MVVFRIVGIVLTVLLFVFALLAMRASFKKRLGNNVMHFLAALCGAAVSFFVVGALSGVLVRLPAVQALVQGLLGESAEVSPQAILALEKTLVALVALPVVFLVVYLLMRGLFSLFFRIFSDRVEGDDHPSAGNRAAGAVLGVLTGVVVAMMLFAPLTVTGDLLSTATKEIPPAAAEYVLTEEEAENATLTDMIFRPLGKMKPDADFYSKTPVAFVYRVLHMDGLFGLCAPLGDLKGAVAALSVYGSYYDCLNHDITYPNARADLTDATGKVLERELLCGIAEPAFRTGLGTLCDAMGLRTQDRVTVCDTVALGTAYTLSAEQKAAENAGVAGVYQCFAAILADFGGKPFHEDGFVRNLPVFGEMLDAMAGTESLKETAPALLDAILRGTMVNRYLTQDEAYMLVGRMQNEGQTYTWLAEQMQTLIHGKMDGTKDIGRQ